MTSSLPERTALNSANDATRRWPRGGASATPEAPLRSEAREPAHAVLVRGAVEHGRITDLNADTARRMSGVIGVWTGSDLPLIRVDREADPQQDPPGSGKRVAYPQMSALAVDRVLYPAQPVAVVVATSRAEAESAAAAIRLRTWALPPITSPRESARLGASPIHENWPRNTCANEYLGDYDQTVRVFDKAAHVTRLQLAGRRPECHTINIQEVVGLYDPESGRCLLRKGSNEKCLNDTEILEREIAGLVQVAQRMGRAIRWVDYAMDPPESGQVAPDFDIDWELALNSDGRFAGIRSNGFISVGAYCLGEPPAIGAAALSGLLAGVYGLPLIEARRSFVLTNTAPKLWPSASIGNSPAYALERLIDSAAREMRLDPLQLRQINVINMEFANWNGRAQTLADLAGFAVRKEDSAKRGRLRGLGVGNFRGTPSASGHEVSGAVYPGGTHVAEIEVDPASGCFAIVKYTAVTGAGETTCVDGIRTYDGEVSRSDARAAVVNALVDAVGGKSIEAPITPFRVWQQLNGPPPMLGLY